MKHPLSLAVLCLVGATVLWSFTGVFVKHFSFVNVDGDVQNLFRYLAAAAGLWLIVAGAFRGEAGPAWRQWRLFLLPAFFNCVFQVVMVSGLYRESIYPGFMSLLSQSSVLYSTVLAYLLFHDERRTIRSWPFLTGATLAVAGVAGVILFGERARPDFGEGVLLVLLSAFLWACYTLAMKPVVRQTRPVVAFTMVATYTALFFAALATARSRPGQFFSMSGMDQFWMILSGVACISAAHSLYFQAVERLGVAVCANFTLVLPLFTGVVSAAALGERLTLGQIVMGAALLAGAYLVILARGWSGPAHEVEPVRTPE